MDERRKSETEIRRPNREDYIMPAGLMRGLQTAHTEMFLSEIVGDSRHAKNHELRRDEVIIEKDDEKTECFCVIL